MNQSTKKLKLSPVQINKSAIKWEYGRIPNGTEAIYAMAEEYDSPVGFIWFRHILIQHIDIMYMFVHERCRRQGIARGMLNELMLWYPGNTIYTALGNEFSTPWLQACGFTQNPMGWFKQPVKSK